MLLAITRLVESVDERTLVLVDEPESHLHPPLLSAFIRALSELLVRRNGIAVVATHSPVVLQEVPRSCVWVLRRSGSSLRAERPCRETFGENVGILTSDVFGAFKYLPADYLQAWLARVRDRHPLLTPAFKLATGMPSTEFWPQLYAAKEAGNICEPDVVFWWEQLAIVVEAKRGSDFRVDQLQIERESTHHATMARGQAAHVIVVAVGRNRPAWWWQQRQSTKHWLAFSSWGTLADVLQATLSARQGDGA